jgi:hypothetical protein
LPDHDTEPVADTPEPEIFLTPAPVAEAKHSQTFNVNNRNLGVSANVPVGVDPSAALQGELERECERIYGAGRLSHVSGRRYRWR